MKNYGDFTIEDFVQDLYFRNWVLGKLNTNDTFWEQWCEQHIEMQETIDQARSIVIGLQYIPEEESQEEIDIAICNILKKRDNLGYNFLYPLRNIAAILTAVVGMALLIWKITASTEDNTIIVNTEIQEDIQWITNVSDSTNTILLPDNSTVILDPLSRIGIMANYNKDDRSVHLVGEAFFEVQSIPEKPFFVYSEKVVTKVLGTSFRIRSYEKEGNVSVSVVSGKVTVKKQSNTFNDDPQEIILVPNQQAIISKTNEKIVRKLVPEPIVVAKTQHPEHLLFNNTPITDVFLNLENAYGITISYDPELFKNCNLTARFSNEDFFQKLDLICETLQAEYSVIDGQILINGVGCN
jgi:transmembrane sensor